VNLEFPNLTANTLLAFKYQYHYRIYCSPSLHDTFIMFNNMQGILSVVEWHSYVETFHYGHISIVCIFQYYLGGNYSFGNINFFSFIGSLVIQFVIINKSSVLVHQSTQVTRTIFILKHNCGKHN
jgi:hypothetical protein